MDTTSMKPNDHPPYWNPSRKTVSAEELAAFADRLHTRMVELGMTQADLARKAFGVDDAGKVRDRDKVSLYLRGKGLPGESKMKALAKALKTAVTELAPKPSATPREAAVAKEAAAPAARTPAFEGVRIEPAGRSGYVMLQVNQRLRHEDAAEIYAAIVKAAKHVR